MSSGYTPRVPAKKAKQTDWLVTVGQRFRALRKKRKKTQKDLGVSPTTIGSLEKGFGAGLDSIETACQAMGVDPREVFGSFPVRSVGEHAIFLTEVTRMFSDPTRRRLMHVIGGVRDEDLADFSIYVDDFKEW